MANNRPRNRTYSEQAKEARGESDSFSVKFQGHTYHIPAGENWSIDALEHLAEAEAGSETQAILFVKALLGSQWVPFKDRHKTAKNFGAFMETVMGELSQQSGDSPN